MKGSSLQPNKFTKRTCCGTWRRGIAKCSLFVPLQFPTFWLQAIEMQCSGWYLNWTNVSSCPVSEVLLCWPTVWMQFDIWQSLNCGGNCQCYFANFSQLVASCCFCCQFEVFWVAVRPGPILAGVDWGLPTPAHWATVGPDFSLHHVHHQAHHWHHQHQWEKDVCEWGRRYGM